MDVRSVLVILTIIGLMAASIVMSRSNIFKFAQVAIAAALVPLFIKFHRQVYIIIKTLPRDIKFLYRYINADIELKRYARNNLTVMKLFTERSAKYPNKPCFIFEGKIWTNADINNYSNRIASVFQKEGFVKGDVVALFMTNKPEFVATWLGLGKLGVVIAFINTNLRLQPFIHCIKVANAKAIIFSKDLESAVEEINDSIKDIAKYEQDCGTNGSSMTNCKNVDAMLAEASSDEPIVQDVPTYKDNLLYIYTSGTTGLPKAALIPNSRYLLVTVATYHMLGLRCDSDVLYNPLPLYHMAGGIVGTCCALIKGIPSVIRVKFSVSAYWTDCIKYNCTLAQYIGEICRYLLNAPPRPEDTAHPVRLMVGNGMRPQIWEEFVNRFKIECVHEVYGSSEGNANIVNVDNQIGAVGFVPSILPKSLHPVGIIRVNENCEPVRGPDGLCIRTEINEPGMFVGLIKPGNPSREFNGYVDKSASQNKIIENVFKKGDKAFLTGDILVQDELGYLYFKDRTGDTFRWKGENVATAEVEGVVSNVAGYRDTTVYGVKVPGMEGRAGMAAIVDPDSHLDFKALAEGLDRALPSYARPIFLRIVKELELTSTFKLKKLNLQKEGFDPNKIQDKVYFRSGNKEYVQVTPELYQDIISGATKI